MKRLIAAFLFWLRFPAAWFWSVFVKPMLLLGYRTYLFGCKIADALIDELKRLMVGFFTSRHVVQAVVVLISFLVTATNIRAADPGIAPDSGENQSVFSVASDADGEETLVEDASAVIPAVESVNYMGGQAIAQQEVAVPADLTGEDSAILDEGDANEPILNALRPLPETDDLGRPATRMSVIDYTVQDGDTVASIALEFDLNPQTVLGANDLGTRGFIKPGQTLRILPVDGIIYKVKKGDNLSSVAKKFKAEPEKIIEMNRMADASDLTVGMELILPDGILPPPPAPPAPTRLANIRDIFDAPTSNAKPSTSRLLWPAAVRRITQYFKGSRHTGVDIGGPIGTPIYAAEAGTVIYSGWNTGGYGNMIIIDHGRGLFTRYGHGSKLLARVGDTVERGKPIMLMGSTGRSTGPHLHFEVMTGNVRHRLNPLEYTR